MSNRNRRNKMKVLIKLLYIEYDTNNIFIVLIIIYIEYKVGDMVRIVKVKELSIFYDRSDGSGTSDG